eukprot:NODE_7356_length_446_cov_1.089514.p1 GENE.NODE_7356_length_446_cov_1.089514~~NODE_7356_length_446_cov_1.089514.p1  ORF type:complete len:132 (-),score=5.42 NODE_7356_length_446_cov_1.089514:51-407(-)
MALIARIADYIGLWGYADAQNDILNQLVNNFNPEAVGNRFECKLNETYEKIVARAVAKYEPIKKAVVDACDDVEQAARDIYNDTCEDAKDPKVRMVVAQTPWPFQGFWHRIIGKFGLH